MTCAAGLPSTYSLRLRPFEERRALDDTHPTPIAHAIVAAVLGRPARAPYTRRTNPASWVGLLAAFSSCVSVRGHAVSGFNGLDAVCKRLFQNAPADGTEHDAEQESLEILALASDGDVNLCGAFGPPSEGVSVAGSASPRVRVGRGEDDVVRIGPVVAQAFPDAAGVFGDVGRRAAALMHLEVPVCAVAKRALNGRVRSR